jgi:hypothetical protein
VARSRDAQLATGARNERAARLRPITDIEDGVMTYVIIETLKALSPSPDPSLPKLRIEVWCAASKTFRGSFPRQVLATANPPTDAAV